jgi:hypothetical protein
VNTREIVDVNVRQCAEIKINVSVDAIMLSSKMREMREMREWTRNGGFRDENPESNMNGMVASIGGHYGHHNRRRPAMNRRIGIFQATRASGPRNGCHSCQCDGLCWP